MRLWGSAWFTVPLLPLVTERQSDRHVGKLNRPLKESILHSLLKLDETYLSLSEHRGPPQFQRTVITNPIKIVIWWVYRFGSFYPYPGQVVISLRLRFMCFDPLTWQTHRAPSALPSIFAGSGRTRSWQPWDISMSSEPWKHMETWTQVIDRFDAVAMPKGCLCWCVQLVC